MDILGFNQRYCRAIARQRSNSYTHRYLFGSRSEIVNWVEFYHYLTPSFGQLDAKIMESEQPMALHYGVLVGRPIAYRLGIPDSSHYQIHVMGAATHYRVAVNIRSRDKSELMYFINEDFRHPVTALLERLPLGFKALGRAPGGMALDYIRGHLFYRDLMRKIPAVLPGPDNDLGDKLERCIRRAMGDEEALVYAFGYRWGPEKNKRDAYFGFLPGNGIHDIHMNQGNPSHPHDQDNGVYQDGALFVRFPRSAGASESRWVAIFLKFQAQAWHTDDLTGNALPGPAKRFG
jgi:uncharacterized protein YukJ